MVSIELALLFVKTPIFNPTNMQLKKLKSQNNFGQQVGLKKLFNNDITSCDFRRSFLY